IFRFWAPLSPGTVFRNILELPPAHFLIADHDSLHLERYWENKFPAEALDSANGSVNRALDQTVEEFRALLIDACRIRLHSDRPVGAYLSGGLDSSTIASVIRNYTTNRLVTFSIAFTDERYDESAFQLQMAAHLGTDHHVISATHADIGQAFPDVVWHAEIPLM